MLPETAQPVTNTSSRSHALDALRGISILAMAFSGYIPFQTLPAWMYHIQVPPPEHKFIPEIPGISWVDLVFPFFLFSMGAAIPLAIANRRSKGEADWRVWWTAFQRFLLLAAFAIVDQHIRPYALASSPAAREWLLALMGFAMVVLMFGRFPFKNPKLNYALKAAGWGGMIAFLLWVRYPDGTGFSKSRSDIIIMVLANMALFGTIAWWLTRQSILARLGVIAVAAAAKICSELPGNWFAVVWNYTPIDWVYRMDFLKYLMIILPGTIAGEIILNWLKSRTDTSEPEASLLLKAAIFASPVPICLWGLYTRNVMETAVLLTLTAGVLLTWLQRTKSPDQQMLNSLAVWGFWWLLIGIMLEPMHGGIKKDPANVQYMFVTSGLAFLTLGCLVILIDLLKADKLFGLAIANGKNPMVAYAGVTNLAPPLLAIVGLKPFLAGFAPDAPWVGVGLAAVQVIILACLVSVFTRLKIYMRS